MVNGLDSSMDPAGSPGSADVEFDARFSVDTGGTILIDNFDKRLPNLALANRYVPTPISAIRRMLDDLPVDPKRFTFVDLGCGKGRVILLAAGRPFRTVIGVEFVPQLHAKAIYNIASYTGHLRCADIRVECADAATFDFPLEPIVLYMFDPFKLPILKKVLLRLKRSVRDVPRPAVIVNYHPLEQRESDLRAALAAEQTIALEYGLCLSRTSIDYRIYFL